MRSFGGVGDEFEKLLEVIFIRLKVYMRGVENEKRGIVVMGEKVVVTLHQFFEIFPLHGVFVGASTFVEAIHERFGCAVLVKGGHMKTTDAIDLFYDGKEEFLLSAPRVRRMSPPGTGCTYSAAITAFLAKGEPLVRAVELAKQHMVRAFAEAYRAGKQTFLG